MKKFYNCGARYESKLLQRARNRAQREKTYLQGFAHSRSPISTFVIRLLESIISKVSTREITIFYELYSLFLEFSAMGLLQDIRNNFHS